MPSYICIYIHMYIYIYIYIYIYGFRIPIPRKDSLHIETGPWFQGISVYCGPINIRLNNMLWQQECFHRAPYQSQSAEHTGCLYGHLNQSCISYCVCISKPHKMNTQSIRNIFLILFPCDFQKNGTWPASWQRFTSLNKSILNPWYANGLC